MFELRHNILSNVRADIRKYVVSWLKRVKVTGGTRTNKNIVIVYLQIQCLYIRPQRLVCVVSNSETFCHILEVAFTAPQDDAFNTKIRAHSDTGVHVQL